VVRKYAYLCRLGILLLLCGIPISSFAQYGPVAWPFHEIGKGLNRTFLYLDAHQYFMSGDNSSEAPIGFRPLFGGLGDGSGLAGGLQYSKPIVLGIRATGNAEISTYKYQKYTVALTKRFRRFETGPDFQYFSQPRQDFFGIGGNSVRTNRTMYAVNDHEYGWLNVARLGKVQLLHELQWRTYDIGPGRSPVVSPTQSKFPATALPGGYQGTQWLTNQVAAVFDFRDDKIDPRSGTAAELSVTQWNGIAATHASFTGLRLVNVTYVPLSTKRFRVLALRTEIDRSLGSDPIPFYLEPTLGGSGTLRGFLEYRFRDRDALAGTAEYRYRMWRFVDGTVFADFGQVYNNILKQIGDYKLQAAGGVGIRVVAEHGLQFHLNIGQSREGTHMYGSLGTSW